MTVDNKSFILGIIGSGPIGLECGLHAIKNGYSFMIFESGDRIANHVHIWSHVRLFTPLSMNISSLGKSLLKKEFDGKAFLTGGEYIQEYLHPISELLKENIRLNHRVISVGRYNSKQFIILVENQQTRCEEYFLVNCVIDASGTYSCPNYVGPGYLPALNERSLRSRLPSIITSHMPNLQHQSLAGKRIILIGKGHSAATSAVALAQLKEAHPDTQLFWIIKQSVEKLPYCCNPDDPLEQRQELARRVNEIYANGRIFTKIYTNSVIKEFHYSVSSSTTDVTLDTSPPEHLSNIDYIIANTGSQPDRSIYADLSVHECYRSKGPMALAVKLFSSSNADCLKQTSHGANSMITTEENFFIVGNKSYGKQTNFLLQIGFEQVADVFQLIQQFLQKSQNI